MALSKAPVYLMVTAACVKKGAEMLSAKNSRKGCFENSETGKQYRRIVAGLGWPYAGMKPGFLVVVAEDRAPDYSLPGLPRHFRVLDELQSENMEELHRTCTMFVNKYRVKNIYTDTTSAQMATWMKLNRSSEDRGIKAVSLSLAPRLDNQDSISFYLNTMKAPLKDQKTLHLGDAGKLRNYFSSIPDDMAKQQLSEFPALAALGYAVIYLTIHEPARTSPPPPPSRHTPGVGGY